ncbi:MAG: hypothetical protein AUF79_16755 [Crenarchaeota archaeon 13_1_20CM_2_51_8]|nr:MAG: hypothetical protein AUF79_16755 [Crenarchaeota archaeon 13_1_20CM_2_51_8]TMI40372.1 MAG: hypothetical protein E6H21_06330 [Candidatus Bathyarchaeota archaeon]
MIVTLASWVYSEYVNNSYFQSYVNSLSPILVPVVSVGFGTASATVATILYFTMRNIRQREGLRVDDNSRIRVLTKRPAKKPQISTSRSERTVAGGLAGVPRPRVPISPSLSPKRGAAQDDRDVEDESD